LNRRLAIAGALLIAAGIVCWANGLDDWLHNLFRLSTSSPLRGPVTAMTRLGGLAVLGPAGLAIVILLAWRVERRRALWLFATIASGRLAVEGLKLAIMRPRPPQADRLDLVASWSFPSSHSAGTMLTCLSLALLARSRAAPTGAILIAVLIGWSRLALGVHWPGDVLAGWGFGLLWIGLWIRQGGPMRSG